MGLFKKTRPMIRLIYLNFEKKFKLVNKELAADVDQTFYASVPLFVPGDLEFRDVCQLVSYIFENFNIDPSTSKGLDLAVEKLGELGFQPNENHHPVWHHRLIEEKQFGKDEHNICKRIPECVDIFIIGERDHLFRFTKLSKRFVDWYVPNVDINTFNRIKLSIQNNKKIR